MAGGTGSRYGSKIPKQFLRLGNKTILEYSIEKFRQCVDHIIIVSHPDWIQKTKKIIKNDPAIEVVKGGKTRQLSVLNGLRRLSEKSADIAVIHDGVRPLFSLDLLKKGIASAKKNGSAVPVIPVKDSLIISKDGRKIKNYLDRDTVYQIQTPQFFHFDLIYKAHILAHKKDRTDFTDDSSVFEMLKLKADIIAGEEHNIKITTPPDLLMAEQILKNV